MGILQDLWSGDICPVSRTDYRNGEFQALADMYERNEKKLLPTLNKQQRETLEKMQELSEERERIVEYAAFTSGFRLAIQLLVDAMGGSCG